ncbi:ABC transporter permease [Neptunitalea chrysea]|uniref:ABC transporter permease n=1 Tax=Neptunitalea chrysea TaxID=1647581 RepID=A0A9W6B8H5_9FLAO|nr:ABC transporter permease [Neptunitalea chrysea]GLB53517.1 ABC transporter permease [Neptunitalea chrysea]
MLIYFRVFKESFNFAINALRNNKLRTFLSLLGVTIGIFSIIAVLAAVDSLEHKIKKNLEGIDKNTMYLTKYSFGPTDVPRWKRDNFPQVTYEEYEYIKNNVGDVEAVAYVIFGSSETLKYEGKTITSVPIVPGTHEVVEIENVGVESGRFFSEIESVTGSPVVVLGYELAENLYGGMNPLGTQLRIFGRKLTVIGVLRKYGESMGDSPDAKAYVPANFVRSFTSGGSEGIPAAIMIKPKKNIDIDAFEQVLKQKIRAKRGLKYEDDDNFFINKISTFTQVIDGIIAMLTLVGVVIGGFSILVGGFGIANIMFVSVKERTNLIGIQKSLGAKRQFILFQFLFEAIVLCLIGGAVGIFFVWIGTLIANSAIGEDFEFILSAGNVIFGGVVAAVIGVIAGILPAWRASRLDPVEAIRTGM